MSFKEPKIRDLEVRATVAALGIFDYNDILNHAFCLLRG